MRASGGVLVLVVATALLTGCVAVPPTPTASPAPPSATPLTAEALAEQGLVESTWTGIDSAGDVTSFTLSPDRSVTVEYNGREWDELSDTWALDDGVLTIVVHVDAIHGELVYTAPYADEATTLDATATATLSGRTLTVVLTRS